MKQPTDDQLNEEQVELRADALESSKGGAAPSYGSHGEPGQPDLAGSITNTVDREMKMREMKM